MKRKTLTLVLPLLAGITLVGSGFSVWYFTANTSNEREVDVQLASYVDIGELSFVRTPTLLYLDSTKHGDNGLNGINMFDAEGSVCNDVDLAYTLDGTILDGTTLQVTVTMEITVDLDAYVDVQLGEGNWSRITSTVSSDFNRYTKTFENLPVSNNTIDMPAFAFSYSSTGDQVEPKTLKEWNDLNSIIADSAINFTYELSFDNTPS